MKTKLFKVFSVLALGGATLFVGNIILSNQEAEARKLAQFEKFPYLSVEDDWCRQRRVHPKSCLTPGNLAKLALQPRRQ